MMSSSKTRDIPVDKKNVEQERRWDKCNRDDNSRFHHPNQLGKVYIIILDTLCTSGSLLLI